MTNLLTYMSIIEEIKRYLDSFREENLPLETLSTDDIMTLKGLKHKESTDDYSRSWVKLSKTQKLNRLMLYHQHLSNKYSLDPDSQKQLKTLLFDGLNSDILDRDHIEYNESGSVITDIPQLQRDSNGQFYFHRKCEHKISNLTTGINFSPATIGQLVAANTRTKPKIIKK